MLTLAKFIRNNNPESDHGIVSRTFGKLAVADRTIISAMKVKPQHNDFWYCDVLKETAAGTSSGVFVLKPLYKIAKVKQDDSVVNDIMYLIPGLYDQVQRDNVLLLYPKRKGPNWIVPNAARRHFMLRSRRNGLYTINTVMVVFDGADNWIRESRQPDPDLDPGG